MKIVDNNKCDTFIVAFRKARKKRNLFLSEKLRDSNITANQIDVLTFLKNNPEYNTAKDIVEYTGVSKGLVSRSIDDLSKRDIILFKADEKDKRKQRLFLTKQGEEIVNQITKYDKDFFKLITKGISKEELMMHKALSLKIQNNLEELENHFSKDKKCTR